MAASGKRRVWFGRGSKQPSQLRSKVSVNDLGGLEAMAFVDIGQ